MILRGTVVLAALIATAYWIKPCLGALSVRDAEDEDTECSAVNYKHPHTCEEDKDCEFVVSWFHDPDEPWVNFTLAAAVERASSVWAAVGFSSDAKMQDTDVVACWLMEDGTAQIHTGWNRPKAHKFVMDPEHNGVSLISACVQDGTLHCSFSRCVNPSDATDKPLNMSWYVLTASGSLSETGEMVEHDKMAATSCKCDVTDCHDDCVCLHSFRYFLLKLHGAVMTVIFLFLVPSGAFISRYYKLVFVSTWINSHIVLMISSSLASVAGLFLVLGHTHFVFSIGVHQLVGIACIGLSVIQPIYGFFRPENGPSLKRKVFNIVHRTLAACILILGCVALFWGCYLFHSSAMAWMLAALGLSLVTNICFILVLELLTRTHKFYTVPPVGYHKVTKHDELSDSEEEVFVRDTPDNTKVAGKGRKKRSDSPDFRMEKTVLVLYILQSFGFAALIAGLIFYYDSTVHH